jgi:hypothetical protein
MYIYTVNDTIEQYRNNWSQHINRMQDTRLPKRALKYRLSGKRDIGRPKKRWRNAVWRRNRQMLNPWSEEEEDLCSVVGNYDMWMMNWKGYGKEEDENILWPEIHNFLLTFMQCDEVKDEEAVILRSFIINGGEYFIDTWMPSGMLRRVVW